MDSSAIQVFQFEGAAVRTVLVNGEPWFVGKDIAGQLGYKNPSEALLEHVDEEDKLNSKTLSSLGQRSFGQRGGWLINESGLYSLILSSKLPIAKEFKRWITSEVLPSLRKTGNYSLSKHGLAEWRLKIEEQKALNRKTELDNRRFQLEHQHDMDRCKKLYSITLNPKAELSSVMKQNLIQEVIGILLKRDLNKASGVSSQIYSAKELSQEFFGHDKNVKAIFDIAREAGIMPDDDKSTKYAVFKICVGDYGTPETQVFFTSAGRMVIKETIARFSKN